MMISRRSSRDSENAMNTAILIYDSDHHVTAIQQPQNKSVGIDCPYTGDGEEFSPANLLCISLGSCMLLALGALASRDHLDLSGTTLKAGFREEAHPFPHVAALDYEFDIPQHFSVVETRKIENAADLCPIKTNISDNTAISVKFNYATAEAA